MRFRQSTDTTLFLWLPETPPTSILQYLNTFKCPDQSQLSDSNLIGVLQDHLLWRKTKTNDLRSSHASKGTLQLLRRVLKQDSLEERHPTCSPPLEPIPDALYYQFYPSLYLFHVSSVEKTLLSVGTPQVKSQQEVGNIEPGSPGL